MQYQPSNTTSISNLVRLGLDPTSLEKEDRTLKALQVSVIKRLSMISEYLNSKPNTLSIVEQKSPFLKLEGSKIPFFPQTPEYLDRVLSVGQFDKETLIYSFIILERFIGGSKLRGQVNFHKLLAVSVYIAFKVLHETEIWWLTDFEDISGFSPQDMRELEIAFLQAVDFKTHVSSKEYEFFRKTLLKNVNKVSGFKAKKN